MYVEWSGVIWEDTMLIFMQVAILNYYYRYSLLKAVRNGIMMEVTLVTGQQCFHQCACMYPIGYLHNKIELSKKALIHFRSQGRVLSMFSVQCQCQCQPALLN